MLRIAMLSFLCLLSSCITGTGEGGLLSVVAGSDSQSSLLSKKLEKYHRAVYWGNMEDALSYILPEKRSFLSAEMRKRRQKERLVDMNIDSIEMVPDSNRAIVKVATRYYATPVYKVIERTETESWVFKRFDGGWYIEDHTAD